MRIIGLACTLGGTALAVAGLFLSSHNMGRAIFAGLGIMLSLAGSLGVLNSYYLAQAIWKK